MTNKKKELEHNILICEQKLDRAEKLIGGLGGEKDRWIEAARVLGDRYDRITGDVLLSSGVVAYLGPFAVDFRNVSLDPIFDLILGNKRYRLHAKANNITLNQSTLCREIDMTE